MDNQTKTNNWWFFFDKEKEHFYCGDCGQECDDEATVYTSTRDKDGKQIFKITAIVCYECEKRNRNGN